MSAWTRLLAASSLAVGNAWAVAAQPTMSVDDMPAVVLFDTPAAAISVSDQITFEVQP